MTTQQLINETRDIANTMQALGDLHKAEILFEATKMLELLPVTDKRRKLSLEQCAEIRRRYFEENITQHSLAVEYGVTTQTICLTINPKSRELQRTAQRKSCAKRKNSGVLCGV